MGSLSNPNSNTVSAFDSVNSVSNPTYGAVSFNAAQGLIAKALVDIDADVITTSGGAVTEMPNQGTGGSGYDMDTVVGTGANLKPHPTGSCLLYGASGDYASTPDSVASSITGDIDIRVRVMLDDWTPASTQIFVGKYGAAGSRSYAFYLTAAGVLNILWSEDGTNVQVLSSTISTGFTDGSSAWVRVTLDVDNGASGHEAEFYISEDNTNTPSLAAWTQLGATVTGVGVTSIDDNSSVLEVGSVGGGTTDNMLGFVYRGAIYNGINGTLAVDFNPVDAGNTGATSFDSSTTGETWTLNGNSFIQNIGHQVVHSIGSVGLETTAGQTISSPVTAFLLARSSSAAPSANQFFFDARSTPSAEMAIITDNSSSDKFAIFQGGSVVTMAESYDTSPHVFTGQFNGDSTTNLTVSGVGSVSGDAGPDDFDFGTVFTALNGSLSMQGYIARLIVFDSALEESEIDSIQSFLEQEYSL